jgi:hypothetical protein
VLSTPPAFNLSQDQTLHLKLLSYQLKRVNTKPIAGLFGHSVICTKVHDASPHTNYLPNF